MEVPHEVIGEVDEWFRDGRATFEWWIPDFSELRPGVYFSPAVDYFNSTWSLGINQVKSEHYFISLGTGVIEGPVRFNIGFKGRNAFGIVVTRDRTFSDEDCRLYIPAIIPFYVSEITITCTLWKEDSPGAPGFSRETQTDDARPRNDEPQLEGFSRETQTDDARPRNDEPQLEVLSSLSEHLKDLLLSGDGHDVVIKVGDKQFRAHKHLLKARSPVFAAMFGNGMAESNQGSVTIEDCDPDAFGEFLQFVYSGKADITSVGTALGLYCTGDKYDFPRLKEMCVHFLKNSFTTTTIFDVVRLAARHDEEELLQQAIVYFADHLEEVMITVEWQRFLLANPIQANEMSLKALQYLKSSLNKK